MNISKHFRITITRLAYLASLVISFFFFPGISDAQWKMVLNNSLANTGAIGFPTVYFLDLPGPPRIGFVATDDTTYKTTDGGFTWYPIQGFNQVAWGFTFKDSLTGWAATNPVVKTTDGGETWFPLVFPSLAGGPNGIYYDSVSGGLFLDALPNESVGNELVSWDEGQTWEPQRPGGHSGGFAFANADTGIECGFYDGNVFLMIRTTDAGHTWNTVTCDSDCSQPLALSGTSTYFLFTILGTVMRSDDAGMTWRYLYTFPLSPGCSEDPIEWGGLWNTGSTIYGNVNDLYIATVIGCYHSTDTGHTWNYLCGMPTFDITESKFYAKGHIVFLQTDSLAGWYSKLWRLNLDSMQYFPTGIAFEDGTKLTTTSSGNMVTINYALTGNDSIGINTGHLVFHFNPNALRLENIKLPTSWNIVDSSVVNGVFNLTISGDSNAQLTNPIIQMTFGTYLSFDSAKIYLDSANLSGHRLNCGCEALSLSGSDSVQVNFEGCGDSTLLAAMSEQAPFSIEGIQPNPAQNEITVTLSGTAQPTVEMYDALGREVLAQGTTPQPPPSLGGGVRAGAGVRLDVSSVPSGAYILRVSDGEYVQSRRVVVQH